MFDNLYLPNYLYPYLIGGFGYESFSHQTASGRIYKYNFYNMPLSRYIIKNARLSKEELLDFYSFFTKQKAGIGNFRLKDPFDNQVKIDETILKPIVKKEEIGYLLSDNSHEVYSIYKIYQNQSSFLKKIYPINASLIKLYYMGSQVEFIYHDAMGIIEILENISDYENIKIEADFVKLVSIVTDNIEYKTMHNGSFLLNDINICEVINEC
ncbi:MAG: DUF2460 domain-containing protein [Rickettsiaceae bacterium]|nr:DUF2460 domain-containing protein [Rickettsiaceae bacterium]